MSEKKCGDCIHYVICRDYVSPAEMFPEVDGGCGAFMAKKEGEWITHSCSFECSVCKEEVFFEFAEDFDPIEDCEFYFCPHCGAKMRNGR